MAEKNLEKDMLSVREISELVNETAVKVPKRAEKRKKRPFILDVLEVVIVAVVMAIALKAFVVEMYWVPSESMVPTIMVKDHVIVTKFNYWFREPQRGEIMVFESPVEKNKNLIKRLIGVPGDTIEFKDNVLYINGQQTAEDYLSDEVFTADYGPLTVPEDMYFMCGDNRQYSSDSRSWGLVSKEQLIGKGVAIYWPIKDLTWL